MEKIKSCKPLQISNKNRLMLLKTNTENYLEKNKTQESFKNNASIVDEADFVDVRLQIN